MCNNVPALLPRKYSPSPKISEKTSPLELQQIEIHQCPSNFREGAHTMYHCIPSRKPDMHFSSNFYKQLNVILITIKYDLQYYS